MIGGYTKLYGHREKAGTSFEITNETFCLFLGMLLPRDNTYMVPMKIVQFSRPHSPYSSASEISPAP